MPTGQPSGDQPLSLGKAHRGECGARRVGVRTGSRKGAKPAKQDAAYPFGALGGLGRENARGDRSISPVYPLSLQTLLTRCRPRPSADAMPPAGSSRDCCTGISGTRGEDNGGGISRRAERRGAGSGVCASWAHGGIAIASTRVQAPRVLLDDVPVGSLLSSSGRSPHSCVFHIGCTHQQAHSQSEPVAPAPYDAASRAFRR